MPHFRLSLLLWFNWEKFIAGAHQARSEAYAYDAVPSCRNCQSWFQQVKSDASRKTINYKTYWDENRAQTLKQLSKSLAIDECGIL